MNDVLLAVIALSTTERTQFGAWDNTQSNLSLYILIYRRSEALSMWYAAACCGGSSFDVALLLPIGFRTDGYFMIWPSKLCYYYKGIDTGCNSFTSINWNKLLKGKGSSRCALNEMGKWYAFRRKLMLFWNESDNTTPYESFAHLLPVEEFSNFKGNSDLSLPPLRALSFQDILG